MVDAPERIWAVTDAGMVGTGRWVTQGTENPHGNVEYVRADLYEQVERERDDAQRAAAFQENNWRQERDLKLGLVEALRAAERLAGSRVKALEWDEAIHGGWVALGAAGVYHVHVGHRNETRFYFFTNPFDHEPNEFCSEEKAKAAAQADYERRILSALAEPAGEAGPLAKFGSPTVAPLGLYRVHWKSGGSSLAAIGMQSNGDRWIAPTNWVRPATMSSAGGWGEIERLEPIQEPAGEVEPVAWRYRYNGKWYVCDSEAVARHGWDVTPLYATPPDASAIRGAATHRHKRRGTDYDLIGIGKMQAEHWRDLNLDAEYDCQAVDMREVAIYRSVDDGSLWVRPREEFEDGRFEPLAGAKP